MRQSESDRAEQFQQILSENRARFGRISRVYGGADNEDLVQEILMQIWRSLPDYQQQATLSTWAYRIAINTAITWKRSSHRAKRRPPDQRLPPDQLPSSQSTCHELDLLNRFLNALSEIDQAVLVMYLDDLTNQEIAAAMGVSHGAIRTRISRIRDRLKHWESDDE
ncbi:MAG: RNA polymerase sigma factor [Planctomycetota bacterium]